MDTIRVQLLDGSREADCLQKATRESMNDILCSVEEEGSMSDRTDSESDEENIEHVSRQQKQYAKKSMKREKKKEKDHRKKLERNIITMDDFLGRQSEFKMWLSEEKHKNTGEMTSPKLKTYFKQFIKLWNKRKLPAKYYRGSSLSESRKALTPTKDSNLLRDEMCKSSASYGLPSSSIIKSPFVTFGKMPPKVFHNKKIKLEFPTTGVSLIAVAPIDSPKPQVKNPVHSIEEYQVPVVKRKVTTVATSEQDTRRLHSFESPPRDHGYDRHGCSSGTEPDFKITSSDSPHVPPPPPPRMDSLKSPSFSNDYCDPYDSLPEPRDPVKYDPVYQDPINCVFSDDSQLAMKKFKCEQKNTLEELQTRGRKLSKDELECMYAKPMKKMKKEYSEEQGSQHKVEGAVDHKLREGGLYAEIMEHINREKQVEDTSNVHSVHRVPKQNRDYATIDECLPTMPDTGDSALPSQIRETSAERNTVNMSHPKFTTLSKAKKRTVMAASTEKIYETYLSYGKKREIEKFKKDIKFSNLSSFKPLSQRCKSQPDVFTGDSLRAFDVDMDQDTEWSDSAKPVTFSSFKPVVNNDDKQSCPSEHADNMKNFHENVQDSNLPRTPIIVATPSFDSLCSVTSHSSSSGSPESVPGKAVSGSSESLSSHSNISEVTSSSLSLSPGYQSYSVIPDQRKEPLSNHSTQSMSLKNREPILVQNSVAMSPGNVEAAVTSKSEMQSDTVNNTTSAPQVTGKGNAVKNGIDLSVYLLKPKGTAKNSAEVEVNGKTGEGSDVEGKVKTKQSVLMFKDSLSGVKTKLCQAGTGKKLDRRQTVTECKPHSQPKSVHTPSIGIAAKARTNARHRDNVADKKEIGSKREFAELDTVEHSYLETDIDNIATETPGLPLKKSKSLGRFETGASTYVTDIW